MSACCALCGSAARLRYDRQADRWACFDGCNVPQAFVATKAVDGSVRLSKRRRTKKRRRDPLFHGFWLDEDGRRTGRATRAELRELHRLWAVHADVREGRA